MSGRTVYRIAMVAPCPFPSLRGSQVLIRELAENLANAGHAVHLVTYPTAQHIVPVERISIHRVPKFPFLWTARPFGWQKVVLDLLLCCLLFRVVRRERVQVIHAHNLEGPLIAFVVRFFTGVPVVYHAHNALSDELPCYFRSPAARLMAGQLGSFLDRRVARRADFSIALSDRLAAFLAVRGAAGRVATVAPAVGRMPIRKPTRAKSDKEFVIMYAGNLDPYQNLPCLLEGFGRVAAAEPRARLVLVTHKGAHLETQQRAIALARRPGVSVRLVNTFAAASRELHEADVLVCPRTSWSGFPIKVLNYMAVGRPIVHARASAHAVEDGVSGLLFTDTDSLSLSGAILRIARDPALAAQLGRRAQIAVRDRYGWRRVLPHIVEVYDQVVEQRNGRRGGRREPESAPVLGGVLNRTAAAPKETVPARPQGLGRRSFKLAMLGMLLTAAFGCGAREQAGAPLPSLSIPGAGVVVSAGESYQLQAGDVLRVKFLYHPELDVKVPVGPDGRVNIQGVGELQAQGKTTEELAAAIKRMSSDRLRDPEVTVIVARLGPRRVYVGGEVRLPGPVVFRDGLTPLQAILDRGGFTEVARIDSVLHLTTKGTSVEATRLNFSRDLQAGEPELNPLSVYDVIYVPRTFIGDANAFVRLYIRGLLPTMPRVSVPLAP